MRFIKALIALGLVGLVLGAAALVAGWFWLSAELAKPGPNSQTTQFTVERGEALVSVATRLETAGLVSDARVLTLKARIDRSQSLFKAGTYAIAPRASASDIMKQMNEGAVVRLRLTLPEGLTTAQILRRVEASADLFGEMPTREIAEGVLLPDTYVFDQGTTRTAFIARMEAAQTALLDQLWAQRAPDLPVKTREEAVILASVVEKETGVAEERGMIAGLFTNRLRKGMRLQSDPTIIYGISKGEPLYNSKGQRRTLFRSEIDRRTDWNTYQIDGLPKTPICNPGRDAIAAVLNPAQTEYLFFVADGKGAHLFARTNAEHERNVAAYRRFEAEEIARERGN